MSSTEFVLIRLYSLIINLSRLLNPLRITSLFRKNKPGEKTLVFHTRNYELLEYFFSKFPNTHSPLMAYTSLAFFFQVLMQYDVVVLLYNQTSELASSSQFYLSHLPDELLLYQHTSGLHLKPIIYEN